MGKKLKSFFDLSKKIKQWYKYRRYSKANISNEDHDSWKQIRKTIFIISKKQQKFRFCCYNKIELPKFYYYNIE